MDNDRDIFESGVPESDDKFSLESILAEYKGTAYIEGDRKTPKDVLDTKTQEILREVLHNTKEIFVQDVPDIDINESGLPAPMFLDQVNDKINNEEVSPGSAQKGEESEDGADPSLVYEEVTEEDARFFDTFSYAGAGATKIFSSEVKASDSTVLRGARAKNIFKRGKSRIHSTIKREEPVPFDTFLQPDKEPEPEPPEPNYDEEAGRLRSAIPMLTLRGTAAVVICFLMAGVTLIADKGGNLPFGIGNDTVLINGILLIMLLFVMMLGIDILISGLSDIVRANPGIESLISLSCIISTISGFVMLLTDKLTYGLSFSVLSAISMYCAIRGKKLLFGAMYTSLKTAVSVTAPRAVVADDCIEDKIALKKNISHNEGFFRRLTETDVAEMAYSIAVPLFVLASFVFSILASFGRGRPEAFAYAFTAIVAVSASFPASLAYSLPFSLAAVSAKRAGGALAGWGGASGIFEADAALITDEDIFPAGTVTISGVKLFEGTPQDKVIRYASSLIIESDSGIAKVFAALLKSQGLVAKRIDEFACYEGGGIGGVIDGEKVLVGSSAFMNLMSIRVPKGMEVRGSVFAAIGDELAAVFTMSYVPAKSVRSALISMLKTKIGMLFAVRDFNVTPYMLEKKFKVSMEGVEVVSAGDCYKITNDTCTKDSETLAVVCREGLGPFAEVILKGRILRLSSMIATAISIVGSVIGMLFIFFIFWKGAFSAISPANTLIYMLAILAIVSASTRLFARGIK